MGNELQDSAFNQLYALTDKVEKIDDPEIKRDWLYLQTSDHFYYMCTKWFSDGDVHKYFNPYGSPYEAFINYMNILSDFTLRVKDKLLEKTLVDESSAELDNPQKLIKLYEDKINELKNQLNEQQAKPTGKAKVDNPDAASTPGNKAKTSSKSTKAVAKPKSKTTPKSKPVVSTKTEEIALKPSSKKKNSIKSSPTTAKSSTKSSNSKSTTKGTKKKKE